MVRERRVNITTRMFHVNFLGYVTMKEGIFMSN